MTTSRRGLLIAALATVAGCSSPEVQPAASAPRVQVGGRVALLSADESARLGPLELLERVGRDVARGRDDEGLARARRHGDAAEGALYAALLGSLGDAPNPGLEVLARAQAAAAGGDWPRLLAARRADPARFAAFARERAAALAASDPDVELSAAEGEPLLELEALRVRVQLARDAQEPELADALAEAGRALALEHAPAQALEFALARDAAQDPAARWVEALHAALAPLRAGAMVGDPAAWSQLLEREPVGAPWPADARVLLVGQAWPGAPAARGEELAQETASGLAWTAVGRWRAARGEPQAALLALRRGHAASRSEWASASSKLLQARALLALDQPAPASALLIGLADRRELDVAQAATALLGSVRLRNGQLRRGHGLLRQAVEEGSADGWPGLGEAEADLGLTYLALGQPERGLDLLHRAQERFQRDGEFPQLRRCLKNELRYLDHAGDARAAEVRARCLRLGADL